MGKNTITLDNFADFHGEVSGVEIRSHLPMEPYVPGTEINVNLGRIARSAHLGRLGSIAFRRYSEQTQVTPGVDSVSEDGSATASFSASASKTPRIDSTIEPYRMLLPVANKGTGVIKINMGHKDMDDARLRDAEPWAHFLDRATSEGLRGCAKSKLLSRPAIRAVAYGLGSIPIGLTALNYGVETSTLQYAQGVGFWSVVVGVIARTRGSTGEFTALPMLPLDRMGLAQIYTRTRKFVETK